MEFSFITNANFMDRTMENKKKQTSKSMPQAIAHLKFSEALHSLARSSLKENRCVATLDFRTWASRLSPY